MEEKLLDASFVLIQALIRSPEQGPFFLIMWSLIWVKTLETLRGSASISSKFVNGRIASSSSKFVNGRIASSSKFVNGHINGTFVSGHTFNLSQKTLSSLEIKLSEKGLGFSRTLSSINEVDLGRGIPDFSRKNGFSEMEGRKMLVKHSSWRVSPLLILQKERLPLEVYF